MAFVFFMTIPGLAVGLIVLAALERAGLWLRVGGRLRNGRAARPRDGRRPVSAAGIELFGAVFQPEGHHALERRKLELVLRDEEHDGAPPRVGVDLDRGVITIRSAAGAPSARATPATSANSNHIDDCTLPQPPLTPLSTGS